MKQCPECRSRVVNLMMVDARNVPELYCERCNRPVAAPRKAAPAPRRPLVAA